MSVLWSASPGSALFFSQASLCHVINATAQTQAQFTQGTNGTSFAFRVQAADQAGNLSAWASYTTTVDTSLPRVENYAPTGIISATQPSLSGQFVNEGSSPIDTGSVIIRLDGDAQTGATVTPAGFTLSLTTPLTEGNHAVGVAVANLAGNGTTTQWGFTVDSLPPTVTLTVPSIAGLNVRLAWQGSDPAPVPAFAAMMSNTKSAAVSPGPAG